MHDAQSWTYGLKAQVGVIGGVLPGFVTGIHKDSVRRWNLWFPSAGVFAEVLAGRAMGMQITFPPPGSDQGQHLTKQQFIHIQPFHFHLCYNKSTTNDN